MFLHYEKLNEAPRRQTTLCPTIQIQNHIQVSRDPKVNSLPFCPQTRQIKKDGSPAGEAYRGLGNPEKLTHETDQTDPEEEEESEHEDRGDPAKGHTRQLQNSRRTDREVEIAVAPEPERGQESHVIDELSIREVTETSPGRGVRTMRG